MDRSGANLFLFPNKEIVIEDFAIRLEDQDSVMIIFTGFVKNQIYNEVCSFQSLWSFHDFISEIITESEDSTYEGKLLIF